jgi:hypothetical protein
MVSMRKHPDMERLERQYELGELRLDTPEGVRWKNRMEASESYFKDYTTRFGWRENQELLSGFGQLMKKYGTYVALPYAITANWVADTYYRNPDPLIQDRGGNRDLGRILSDVAKAIHAETDSERKMKDALGDQSWAGFGCMWASFVQQADYNPEAFDHSTGEMGAYEAKKQRVVLKRISPWRIRFDPKGRDWDLSDHGYVAIDYERSLASLMRDPKLSDDDKRRLMTFHRSGAFFSQYAPQQVRFATETSYTEDDPEHVPVYIRQIWSRHDHMVYDMPLGASFTFEPREWDPEFAEADVFPLHYMAKNREPEDESSLCGFIGIPDLTLIRPHIYAIQKLEALFLAANQHVINKYLMPKGALGETEKTKLGDGVKQFTVVEWDPSALAAFPVEMREKIGSDDILKLVKQGELKELHHLEGIRHELDMIAQIIGQGGADRGGLSEADSATESLGMQQGLARRRSNAIHVNGKHYNAVTKLIFLILKARQTLPIRYAMTSRRFNERVWAEFNADTLKDLDLHFDYAVGSSELRTREEEFALRERMATVLLPVLQARGDTRLMMKLAGDLCEVLNVNGWEEYFNDTLIDTMKQLVALQQAIGKGLIPADDPRVAARMMELITIAATETLTEQDLKEVVASSANAPQPEAAGGGSIAAPPTPGQSDYDAGARGSAMSGMGGGMAN